MELALDRRTVELVARVALEAPDAVLLEHRVVPLAYDAYLPGRAVTRVEGRAQSNGAEHAWSAIRKWTESPQRVPNAPSERGRREALAYRSGLLADPPGLRAPRALVIDLPADGSVDLWLEDIRDEGPDPWPPETFAQAAHALGRFNARWPDNLLPDVKWLVADWAERQSEPLDVRAALADIEAHASSPRAVALLGPDAGGRAAQMLLDQPGLITLLGQLPQVICHHDAARSNLMVRRAADGGTEIVAIDWESTGPGSVGADIATLVSGSVRKGDVSPDDLEMLGAAVFAAYLEGLDEAGWAGDSRIVRLGYTGALALRCWFVRDTLRNLADPEAKPIFGRALDAGHDDVLAAFASISRFLLDRADEARRLATELGK